jgi:hypothetical protein
MWHRALPSAGISRQSVRTFDGPLVVVIHHGVITDLVPVPQLRSLDIEFAGRLQVRLQERAIALEGTQGEAINPLLPCPGTPVEPRAITPDDRAPIPDKLVSQTSIGDRDDREPLESGSRRCGILRVGSSRAVTRPVGARHRKSGPFRQREFGASDMDQRTDIHRETGSREFLPLFLAALSPHSAGNSPRPSPTESVRVTHRPPSPTMIDSERSGVLCRRYWAPTGCPAWNAIGRLFDRC